LLRNIPSAVLRFTIYEELKHIFVSDKTKEIQTTGFDWKLFAAGAAAGTISSGLLTPVDVIKTRMATGTCPVDMPGCLQHVIQEGGVRGLYMGAGSRIVWSTAFAAIGFGMLETAKGWLGVADTVVTAKVSSSAGPRMIRPVKMFSRHQRALERAVSDKYE
jgi:solute carrier family 25 S-adenosylmethionine transporter 26